MAEAAPPSLLYRANTDHLAMPAMLALLRIGDELRNRMAERIAQWPLRPVSVVIYGSVARGDATTGSDLDVLVVRSDATEPDDPTWQHQVAELADRVYWWTGKRHRHEPPRSCRWAGRPGTVPRRGEPRWMARRWPGSRCARGRSRLSSLRIGGLRQRATGVRRPFGHASRRRTTNVVSVRSSTDRPTKMVASMP